MWPLLNQLISVLTVLTINSWQMIYLEEHVDLQPVTCLAYKEITLKHVLQKACHRVRNKQQKL